jgi:hypothetical protein
MRRGSVEEKGRGWSEAYGIELLCRLNQVQLIQLTEFWTGMNSVHIRYMVKCQRGLGILGFCGNFCGKVLMLKNGFGKVSEFLELLKIDLYQRDGFWSKFELDAI